MEILNGDIIQQMTGYSQRSKQKEWFENRGYQYQTDCHGDIWTTDDWMNGKDRHIDAKNDDGFNLGSLKNAS